MESLLKKLEMLMEDRTIGNRARNQCKRDKSVITDRISEMQ